MLPVILAINWLARDHGSGKRKDFQARLTREYIASTRERQRIPTNTYREANIGHVVLVGEDAPRLS